MPRRSSAPLPVRRRARPTVLPARAGGKDLRAGIRSGLRQPVAFQGVIPRAIDVALQWLQEGRRVVAATLVDMVGSAPLDPGFVMLVDDEGRIDGLVYVVFVYGALVVEAYGDLD